MLHLTDAQLLQLADQELPPEQSTELELHLTQCHVCLARQAGLLDAMAGFIGAREALLLPPIPPGDASSQLLRTRLQAFREAPAPQPKWVWPAVAAALVVSGFWWLTTRTDRPLKPDARLTPGATLALSREQICAVPANDSLRVVPASLAGQVFNNYGIQPAPRRYEVDYLIAPALGGATDVRNLWPQPYATGVWNAGVKDALETQLRQLVCQGLVDLPTAQREIATDWIAAYRKYFQTDLPLAAHASYRKDRPWE